MTARAMPTTVVMLKEVPGGFVCQVPNEWLIGRSRHYFVTEAQKDQIIAQSPRPTFAAVFSWMVTLPVLGAGAAMALNWARHSYQFDEPTLGDMAIIMAATLVSMMLAARMAFRPLMTRLRPLLATLPKSDIQFTRDDMRRAMEKMNDPKQLRRQAALYGIIVASILVQLCVRFKAGRSMMSGDPLSVLLAVAACIVGVVAILLLRQAQQKAKQEPGKTLC